MDSSCGVAALMSCTTLCVFCCISCNFAFGGRSFTLLRAHGTMSPLMFGPRKASQLPRNTRERMRRRCVLCVVKRAPRSQFVVSARSIAVLNVLVPTLVGIGLFVRHMRSDMH